MAGGNYESSTSNTISSWKSYFFCQSTVLAAIVHRFILQPINWMVKLLSMGTICQDHNMWSRKARLHHWWACCSFIHQFHLQNLVGWELYCSCMAYQFPRSHKSVCRLSIYWNTTWRSTSQIDVSWWFISGLIQHRRICLGVEEIFSSNQRSNQDSHMNKQCERPLFFYHCNKPGHIRDKCWKLHGKPPDWKTIGSLEGRGFTSVGETPQATSDTKHEFGGTKR